jgi:hypothetical protein
MTVVWSAICALAALAAGAQQASGGEEAPQMRTKVLPGHGYIRYEVMPGDDETPAGELIVIQEERRLAPPSEAVVVVEESPRRPARTEEKACSRPRAKLVARLFEMQGMQIEPEFAEWLEKNLTMGRSNALTIQLVGGEPFLVTAIKADAIARGLAEDLARCERAQSR